jgi:hypothetical protein
LSGRGDKDVDYVLSKYGRWFQYQWILI